MSVAWESGGESASSTVLRLWNRLLKYIWYIHPKRAMLVMASPYVVQEALKRAARPSTQRLHLRDLFAQGRRYHFKPILDGFQLSTTSKVAWHYRRRTKACAVLTANMEELDTQTSRIHIQTRFRMLYLLEFIWLPLFMTSIIVYMPWHPLIIAVLTLLLFGLSWGAHRSHAGLEALEMIYFVEKVLEDFIPKDTPALEDTNPSIIYNQQEREFAEAWEKFYEAHTQD